MRDRWTPPIVFAVSFAGYVATLCPTVYAEGAGELIGATYLLGIPHPTGYPLYCLVGRLFCAVSALVPKVSPALAVNAFTAATGAGAAAALAWLLRTRGCHSWVALGSGLAFAFSATFWSQSVITEVYGLSALFTILVLGAGLRAADGADYRSVTLLGLLWGMGLTTHLHMLLLAPGLAGLLGWGMWQRRRASGAASPSVPGVLIAGVLAAVIGYSLVLYLPLRSGRSSGFEWGSVDDPGLLWDHLTGALYRSSFFSLPVAGVGLNAQRWLHQAWTEFHPLLVPVVIWGVWTCRRRDWRLLTLAGSGVCLNLFTSLQYHRDPAGASVFYLLSVLCLALFMGFGLDDLARRAGRRLPGRGVPGLLGLVPAILLATTHWAAADRSGNWIAHRYGRDLLESLPRDAVLLTDGDDASYVLDYLQRMEGFRPDVDMYNRMGRGTDLLSEAQRRLPPAAGARLRIEREGAMAAAPDTRVFCVFARGKPAGGFRFEPTGMVYEIVSTDASPAPVPPSEAHMANARAQDVFRDPWIRKIQANYWFMRGEALARTGAWALAEAAFDSAADLAHDSRTMRFNVGLMLYRNRQMDKALVHLMAGIELDPLQPMAYGLAEEILRRQGRLAAAEDLRRAATKWVKKP